MLYKKNLFFAVFATLFLASCDLDLSLTTEGAVLEVINRLQKGRPFLC